MTLHDEVPHPGQDQYPDLEEDMFVEIDKDVRAYVMSGRVVFVRYDEDTNDSVSIAMSEWDFGTFVEKHLMARLGQKFPQIGKIEGDSKCQG